MNQVDKNLIVPKTIDKNGIAFYDATKAPFSLHGVWYEDGKFYRVDKDVAPKVSPNIVQKSTQTAGGRVRFKTNSTYVAIKAVLHNTEDVSIMADVATKGFDFYADGVFVRCFSPVHGQGDGDFESIREIDKKDVREREITVNLPLYSGIKELYIGLDEGATLSAADPYKISKPVVFYGSSITNGACASRPGMTFESMVSRRLGCDFHNLGFGGSAKGESAMAEYVAGFDMSAFILDYDHNAPTVEHLAATHEAFYKTVREKHPNIPIVMLSRPQDLNREALSRRFEVVKATYDNAVAAGDKNVYLINGSELFDGFAFDYTVDAVHPNDLGFYRMAEAVSDILEKAFA